MYVSHTSDQFCNPCVASTKPISQIKRFHWGDKVRVKTNNAGYVQGAILVIYGYSRTPEGLNIIIDGTTPWRVRDSVLCPEGMVQEVLFKLPARTIAEVPVLTAEEYLEYIPYKAAPVKAKKEQAKVIPMYNYGASGFASARSAA